MKKYLLLVFVFVLCGCVQSLQEDITGKSSQVETRSYQTYTFENENENLILTSIISTMQDLDFIIDKVDSDLKIVSGTSFKNGSKLTVTVRKKGNNIIVRANAQNGLKVIDNPIPYQNFFNSLSQSVFLEKNM